MVLSINWLRILIVCLALVSFIFGMILREELEGLDGLTLLLVSEALTAILYSVFVFNSKRTQIRIWRIFLRSVMGFLMIYGPVKTLSSDCKYSSGRNYRFQSPGFSTFELIECDDGFHYDWYWEDGKLLRAYRYYRARCIIALTVCALVLVELLCYWRSTEGSRVARDDALTEAREDVELGNVASVEPQKMELPDPRRPTAA